MARFAAWSAALILLSTALPRSAAAAGDSARAQQLLADGSALFRTGDFEKAHDRFQAAYDLSGNPKILYDIAQCELSLLRPTQAAAHFHEFLDRTAADPALASSDFRKNAQERLARLDTQLGRIFIVATPREAQVLLDGKPAAAGRQYVTAEPATHTVTAVAKGYRPGTQTVSVPAGQLVDASLALESESSPSLAPSAAATTAPESEAPIAVAPAAISPSTEPDRVPAYMVGAGAGVLAIVALSLGLATQSQYNALPANSTSTTTAAENRVLTQARITDVLWAASVVTAGVGTYLWFSAAPTSGGGGEVAVGGRF